jgi:hypothetical protein
MLINCISVNEGNQCIYCRNITYLEVIQFTSINLNLMSFMWSHWFGCQICCWMYCLVQNCKINFYTLQLNIIPLFYLYCIQEVYWSDKKIWFWVSWALEHCVEYNQNSVCLVPQKHYFTYVTKPPYILILEAVTLATILNHLGDMESHGLACTNSVVTKKLPPV